MGPTIDPEVLEPEDALPPDLRALRKLARTLDSAFAVPGTSRRVGIAPVVGLVPGFGDAVTAIISTWIVVGAIRHRVPPLKVAQMTGNIILDFWLGSIPLIGDVFDFFFQENLNNVDLLLKHRDRRRPPRTYAEIGAVAMFVVTAILAIGVILVIGSLILLFWLLQELGATI